MSYYETNNYGRMWKPSLEPPSGPKRAASRGAPEHGIASYNKGCRCDACRAACREHRARFPRTPKKRKEAVTQDAVGGPRPPTTPYGHGECPDGVESEPGRRPPTVSHG